MSDDENENYSDDNSEFDNNSDNEGIIISNKNNLTVSFKDNGNGIKSSIIENIFNFIKSISIINCILFLYIKYTH